MRIALALATLLATTACASVDSATAKPISCPSGYYKQGNRCVPVPTPKPLPSAAVNDLSVPESGGTVPVHILLAGGNSQPSTVNYAIAPGHGTAIPGTDFVAATGTVTFQPGETDKTIPLTIIDNKTVTGNRDGVITLTAGSNVQIGRSALFTILEDDVAAPPPPEPSPPPSGTVTVLNRPLTYGDVFQATQACVSDDNATDVLTVGALYDVVAVGGYTPVSTDATHTTGPDVAFVYLLTHPTDNRHFGDGAFSMHMPATCGVPVAVAP